MERVEAEGATPAPAKAQAAAKSEGPTGPLLDLILKSLDDDKAEDVVAIDLRGKSEMADHMVIATGRSSRQVAAMSEKLAERIKAETGRGCRLEGKDTADWVLIDCGDAVVHIFRAEVREFYQLEKMWLSPAEQAAKLSKA